MRKHRTIKKAFLYSELHTRTTGRICCHNIDYVNGHDRNIFVILSKYRIRLPDDGSFVIRNMSEQFQIFYEFTYIYELYICAFVG